MNNEHEIFVEAQDTVWPNVLSELEAGRKTSHWMWFVFPQLAVLGRSNTSQLFGLHDLEEAEEYLRHPVLRQRLVDVAGLILVHPGKSPKEILGSTDARKLQSSMTLFSRVADAPPEFARVIEVFFGGEPCPLTLRALGI